MYFTSAPKKGHPSILGKLTIIQIFFSQGLTISIPKSRNLQYNQDNLK